MYFNYSKFVVISLLLDVFPGLGEPGAANRLFKTIADPSLFYRFLGQEVSTTYKKVTLTPGLKTLQNLLWNFAP